MIARQLAADLILDLERSVAQTDAILAQYRGDHDEQSPPAGSRCSRCHAVARATPCGYVRGRFACNQALCASCWESHEHDEGAVFSEFVGRAKKGRAPR